METGRAFGELLKQGWRPKRTIIMCAWDGEEEGLLGSKAYVEQHFGTFENPKPEWAKFDGYFNIDFQNSGKDFYCSALVNWETKEMLVDALKGL